MYVQRLIQEPDDEKCFKYLYFLSYTCSDFTPQIDMLLMAIFKNL